MDPQQKLDALKRISFMRFLPEETAKNILREGKTISIKPGEILFNERQDGEN